MSSEDVHPAHALCLAMIQQIADLKEQQKENEEEEKAAKQEAVEFIKEVVSSFMSAQSQTGTQLPIWHFDFLRPFDQDGIEIKKSVQGTILNYCGTSPSILLTLEGSLMEVGHNNIDGWIVKSVLIEGPDNFNGLEEAKLDQLIRVSQQMVHGPCKIASRYQNEIDDKLREREVIHQQTEKLRVIRNALKEAARRTRLT